MGAETYEPGQVRQIRPQFVDHRREAAVKQQQAAIERIEDELVFYRLVAWIDRTPDGSGARDAEYTGKGDRIVAGQDRDFLPGGNAGIGESACDPIAKALYVTIAQALSVHGQAWSIGTKRRALIQIVDKPHGLPAGKKADGAVIRPPGCINCEPLELGSSPVRSFAIGPAVPDARTPDRRRQSQPSWEQSAAARMRRRPAAFRSACNCNSRGSRNGRDRAVPMHRRSRSRY